MLEAGLAFASLPLASILAVHHGISILAQRLEWIVPGAPVEGRLALVLFQLSTRGTLPPPVAVEIMDTPPKGSMTVDYGKVRLLLLPGSRITTNYKLVARAGRRRFGEVMVTVTDLLGLYRATITLEPNGDRYIQGRPKVVEPESKSETEGVILSTAARTSEKHGLEFYAVREYVEGDDPRLIDWKATARLATLIVKEMRQEAASPTIIMFSPGPEGDEGKPGETLFEVLARRLAGIAMILSSYNQLIGYIGLAGEPVITPPSLAAKGFYGVLDGLANTPPAGPVPFNTAAILAEYLAKYVRARPVLVIAGPSRIVSDMLGMVEPILLEHGIPALLLEYRDGKVEAYWRAPR